LTFKKSTFSFIAHDWQVSRNIEEFENATH
jgi:hypothetical protein